MCQEVMTFAIRSSTATLVSLWDACPHALLRVGGGVEVRPFWLPAPFRAYRQEGVTGPLQNMALCQRMGHFVLWEGLRESRVEMGVGTRENKRREKEDEN